MNAATPPPGMEKLLSYPSIEECVRMIAEVAGAPVNVVATALLAQSEELGMDAAELVHAHFRIAVALARSPL